MTTTSQESSILGFFALGGLAAVVGGVMAGNTQVDADLARENYTERTSVVETVSEVVGAVPSITTADGFVIGFESSACSMVPSDLTVGDAVTVATLPSVNGSNRLTLVGPCDPVKMADLVTGGGSWLRWDTPYVERSSTYGAGTLVAGSGIAMVLIASVRTAVYSSRQKRSRVPA